MTDRARSYFSLLRETCYKYQFWKTWISEHAVKLRLAALFAIVFFALSNLQRICQDKDSDKKLLPAADEKSKKDQKKDQKKEEKKAEGLTKRKKAG